MSTCPVCGCISPKQKLVPREYVDGEYVYDMPEGSENLPILRSTINYKFVDSW